MEVNEPPEETLFVPAGNTAPTPPDDVCYNICLSVKIVTV